MNLTIDKFFENIFFKPCVNFKWFSIKEIPLRKTIANLEYKIHFEPKYF
jgi:hypothetical protein